MLKLTLFVLLVAAAACAVALSWAFDEEGPGVAAWPPWTTGLVVFSLLGLVPWCLLPGRRALFLLRRHRRKDLPSSSSKQPMAADSTPAQEPSAEPPAELMPRWRLSRALPIALTLIAAGLWFGAMQSLVYWTGRHSGSSVSYYTPARAYAIVQLALRSVAIRQFVHAHGRLPGTLAECDGNKRRLLDMIVLSQKNPMAGYFSPIDEPWWPKPTLPNEPKPEKPRGSHPPIELDFFGLPLLYQPGASRAHREGWIDASSALPSDVITYLEKSGGVPPRSKLPYALSSVFVQHLVEQEAQNRRQVSGTAAVMFGGLAGLLCSGLLIVIIWRGKPLRWFSWVGVGASAALAVLFTGGSLVSQATCYVMASFHSSALARRERLAILEQAVARGEVTEQVAAKARRFINELPQSDHSQQ